MKENKLQIALKGMAMGVAEVIPGVSGGTIAFITGIYEQLINSITSIGPELISAYKTDGLKGAWKAFNGPFMLFLLLGMGAGLILGIFGVTYFIEHYPEPLWGFFFGLILASSIYMGRQIKDWNILKFVLLVVGAIVAYFITVMSPAEGSLNPIYVFISGVIAISALILPGISGSFILLLMGMYTLVISTMRNFLENFDGGSFLILAIFGSGCLVGLAGFSRVLKWLFASYKEASFAVLTGFLIGALNKVWPWRNVSHILDKDSGEILEVKDLSNFGNLDMESIKIIQELNVLPSDYLMSSPKLIATIIVLIVGFCVVFLLEKLESEK